jgi:hypothetical protein
MKGKLLVLLFLMLTLLSFTVYAECGNNIIELEEECDSDNALCNSCQLTSDFQYGDLNLDENVDVVDLQCMVLVLQDWTTDETVADCLQTSLDFVDFDCDGDMTNVDITQVSLLVNKKPLGEALDKNTNLIPDCQESCDSNADCAENEGCIDNLCMPAICGNDVVEISEECDSESALCNNCQLTSEFAFGDLNLDGNVDAVDLQCMVLVFQDWTAEGIAAACLKTSLDFVDFDCNEDITNVDLTQVTSLVSNDILGEELDKNTNQIPDCKEEGPLCGDEIVEGEEECDVKNDFCNDCLITSKYEFGDTNLDGSVNAIDLQCSLLIFEGLNSEPVTRPDCWRTTLEFIDFDCEGVYTSNDMTQINLLVTNKPLGEALDKNTNLVPDCTEVCASDNNCAEGEECQEGVCMIKAVEDEEEDDSSDNTNTGSNNNNNDKECAKDNDCSSGNVCEGGKCVSAPSSTQCTKDEHCWDEKVCQNFVCVDKAPEPEEVEPECLSNDGCAADQYCQDEKCVQLVCGEGQIINNHQCVTPVVQKSNILIWLTLFITLVIFGSIVALVLKKKR